MHALAEAYPEATFLGVYISEAHASDEWPLGAVESVPQHKTLEDRLARARDFARKYEWKLPLVVDGMNNAFAKLYGAWPERFFIVKEGKVANMGQPTAEFGFDRHQIDAFLRIQYDADNGSGADGAPGDEAKTTDGDDEAGESGVKAPAATPLDSAPAWRKMPPSKGEEGVKADTTSHAPVSSDTLQ